mmetsp:Transcript_56951/g.129036  ORF Transcript_56951/g.129036 Transcript_56951/m.129036 type:complete len:255 (+) Transcript_56951:398-1162(+)
MHAASLTSEDPEFDVHSMHAYFLRPGDTNRHIVYNVKRTRDGRSFASRSVEASQKGRVIFKASVSFHRREATSVEHQTSIPDVPGPDELEPFDYERLVKSLLSKAEDREAAREAALRALDRPFPIDIRWVGKNPANLEKRPARQLAWIKTSRPLPNNNHLHRAAAAFYSDYFLLATALLPHGIGFPSSRIDTLASLDHSMWFHDVPFRADEWSLLELESPRASGARALSFGRLYTRDGIQAVSCAQEGLIRLKS